MQKTPYSFILSIEIAFGKCYNNCAMIIRELILKNLEEECGVSNLEELLSLKDLSNVLTNNELIMLYVNTYNLVAINSFMLGRSPFVQEHGDEIKNFVFNPDKMPTEKREKQLFSKVQSQVKTFVERGRIPVRNLEYAPITPSYIRQLIRIDEVFRLSKYWNKRPRVLYKGDVVPKDLKLDKLNSFSTSKFVAGKVYFSKGALLIASLPAGFPAIDILKIDSCDMFKNEKEVLLPPCDFESASVRMDACERNYEMEVKLRPLSLASVMLEKMKNPPSDYPREFLTDPAYGYDKALSILSEYVKNYVDQKRIRINDQFVKELDGPTVLFLGDEEKGSE